MSLCNLFRLRQNRQFCRQHAALLHQNLRCFPRIGRHKSIYYIVTASRSLQPHACLWVHTLPVIPRNPSVGCVRYARGLSKLLPFPPPHQRSSEPHFQTTFCHSAKQEFPLPSPQTPPKPVNFPYFNNFLETNHAPYPPAPPVPAPYRRTRPAVFSAGQSSRCPKNFCRALSGGGVWFGTLFGMAEAG